MIVGVIFGAIATTILRVMLLIALLAVVGGSFAVTASMRAASSNWTARGGYATLEEINFSLASPLPTITVTTPMFYAESPPLLPSMKPERSGAGQPHPYSADIEAVRAKHRAGYMLSASELFLLEEALNLEEALEARQHEVRTASWSA
jgi:hypothetical protein|eukprot:jgi/Chrpa1/1768/Chrysochromulina_OHIO_Genome00013660-RA